jgi:hypothetical protein
MKTYHIKLLTNAGEEIVTRVLSELSQRGMIEFSETDEEAVPASEDQVQEIIEEAELTPYYSENEAKKILNL